VGSVHVSYRGAIKAAEVQHYDGPLVNPGDARKENLVRSVTVVAISREAKRKVSPDGVRGKPAKWLIFSESHLWQ